MNICLVQACGPNLCYLFEWCVIRYGSNHKCHINVCFKILDYRIKDEEKNCCSFYVEQSTKLGGPMRSITVRRKILHLDNEEDVHMNFKNHDKNNYMHYSNLLIILHHSKFYIS